MAAGAAVSQRRDKGVLARTAAWLGPRARPSTCPRAGTLVALDDKRKSLWVDRY